MKRIDWRQWLAVLILVSLGGCANVNGPSSDQPAPAAAQAARTYSNRDDPDDEDAFITYFKEQWELIVRFCQHGFPPLPD